MPLPDSEFFVFCSIQMVAFQTANQGRKTTMKMVPINKDDGSNAYCHSFDTSPSGFSNRLHHSMTMTLYSFQYLFSILCLKCVSVTTTITIILAQSQYTMTLPRF